MSKAAGPAAYSRRRLRILRLSSSAFLSASYVLKDSSGGTNLEWRASAGNENSCNSNSTILVSPGTALTQIVSDALADSGGPTPTLALPDGSPAIDTADPAYAIAFDQRGQVRPAGNGPDLGAFEKSSNSPVTTTMTLTGSPNPAKVGEAVTLTATITGNSPSGTVTFKSASTTLGTVTLSGGVATLTTSFASAGNRSLTASYGGDATNTASTSAVLRLPVNKTASAITVTAMPNPVVVDQTVTLKATVTGNAPSGTVTFKSASTILGTAPLSAGEATLTASFASVGNRPITASYGGDTSNTDSVFHVLATSSR